MTITAAQLLALRDRGKTHIEATKALGISLPTFRGLTKKFAIRWPNRCGKGHPLLDRILIGHRDRCRLCYLAELEKRKQHSSPYRQQEPNTLPTAAAAIIEANEALAALERAVARENAPPWVRHPVPYDPRDVVYRAARAAP